MGLLVKFTYTYKMLFIFQFPAYSVESPFEESAPLLSAVFLHVRTLLRKPGCPVCEMILENTATPVPGCTR